MSSFTSIIFLLSLLSLYTHPTFSQKTTTSCKSHNISQTFDNCADLPTLNAVLHWSYIPSNSSLSVAFTASPPKPDGWVAWGLNPNGTGMVGAQIFLAHKPSSSNSVTATTYNLKSIAGVSPGPFFYKVTSISAQDSNGVITIFGTWALPKGVSTLNQVWQVGPMNNGNVGKHDFTQANLGAKQKLNLSGANGPSSGPSGAPDSPSGSASSPSEQQNSPPTNSGQRLVSGVVALVAMVVCFLF